jgi:hypothetical protein
VGKDRAIVAGAFSRRTSPASASGPRGFRGWQETVRRGSHRRRHCSSRAPNVRRAAGRHPRETVGGHASYSAGDSPAASAARRSLSVAAARLAVGDHRCRPACEPRWPKSVRPGGACGTATHGTTLSRRGVRQQGPTRPRAICQPNETTIVDGGATPRAVGGAWDGDPRPLKPCRRGFSSTESAARFGAAASHRGWPSIAGGRMESFLPSARIGHLRFPAPPIAARIPAPGIASGRNGIIRFRSRLYASRWPVICSPSFLAVLIADCDPADPLRQCRIR